MKFEITKDRDLIGGTSLKGYLRIKYRDLVSLFGKPVKGDGVRTRAEWVLRFADGTVGTIYDYACAEPLTLNRDWHIGGTDYRPEVIDHVMKACADYVMETVKP